MSKYKLSICIPTYNRAEFIGETIQSAIDAAEGISGIEIVISDNASTDNTKNIVDSYKEFFPNITYFCWDKNMGADINFLKAIQIADGEFCWLMGSDDKIEKNGINIILKYLQDGLCGLSVNSQEYKLDLKEKIIKKPQVKQTENSIFINADDCLINLGVYFGYMSAQIVNKKEWDKVVLDSNLHNYINLNGYIHMYIIGMMLKNNPNWIYIYDKCVGWRGENDSILMSEGRLKRLAVDVYGYEKIFNGLSYKKGSLVYDETMKKLCSSHIWSAILSAKLENMPLSFYKKAFKMCFNAYKQFPIFWLKVFPLFLIPSKAMPLARVIYRKFLKKYV